MDDKKIRKLIKKSIYELIKNEPDTIHHRKQFFKKIREYISIEEADNKAIEFNTRFLQDKHEIILLYPNKIAIWSHIHLPIETIEEVERWIEEEKDTRDTGYR